MADITYSWNFNPLEVVFNEEAMTNVIDVVHWQYTGTLDDTSITNIGTIKLAQPTPEGFIPFENVTKEMVTSWVETTMGEDQITSMQTSISSSINTKLHPTRGPVSPPWVTPPVPPAE